MTSPTPTTSADGHQSSPPAAPGTELRLFGREYRALTLGVVGVVLAVAFEAIAVATAMPVAARDLGGLRYYGLAFSVFLTASLLGMVVSGEVSDRRGPILPFLMAAVVFGSGLALAGAAPSMWVLVVARAVQGFGGGLNIVALYVIVARAFPEGLRPRVFSAMSSGWILPSLVGPLIAGFLADEVSWRWVFLGVLPLLVGATLLILPRLRHLDGSGTGDTDTAPSAAPRSRLLPALAAAIGVGLLQSAGQLLAWVSLPLLVAAAALLVPSVPRLLPPGALRFARGLPTVVTLRGVFSGAFFGAETFVPLMLIEERGLATTWAGASLTGGALTWALGSWYQGRPSLGVARTRLIGVGFLLVAAGIALVALATLDSAPPVAAAVGWVIAGLGMGVGLTSCSVLVLELSPAHEQGANSAALQVSDALGSIVMIGIASAIFAGLHAPDGGDVKAFLLIDAVMIVFALVGAAAGHRSAPAAQG